MLLVYDQSVMQAYYDTKWHRIIYWKMLYFVLEKYWNFTIEKLWEPCKLYVRQYTQGSHSESKISGRQVDNMCNIVLYKLERSRMNTDVPARRC